MKKKLVEIVNVDKLSLIELSKLIIETERVIDNLMGTLVRPWSSIEKRFATWFIERHQSVTSYTGDEFEKTLCTACGKNVTDFCSVCTELEHSLFLQQSSQLVSYDYQGLIQICMNCCDCNND